jgi:adenylate cyclase class IV
MKLEKEIKILDINIHDVRKKLESIGAEFQFETRQKIYTYDLPTIYYRFLEIKHLLGSSNPLIVNTNKTKLELLFLEIEDLLSNNELSDICTTLGISELSDIVNRTNIIDLLDSDILKQFIGKLLINPNKWIRLRETNGKSTITVKHVLNKNNEKIQKVLESETEVQSLEEMNSILNAIGIVRRNFQEKIRYQYLYKDAEISLDIWPQLAPYMEIESDDANIFPEIIKACGLETNEILSLNTEEMYREKGILIHETPELRFNAEKDSK